MLPDTLQTAVTSFTETPSEASGANGILVSSRAAWVDAYETVSAFASELRSLEVDAHWQEAYLHHTSLEFGPGDSYVVQRPRVGFVPKGSTTLFRGYLDI